MATYLELRGLVNDGDLSNKIDIAIVIAANNLLSGTPTTAQQKWAASVFNEPRSESKKALMAVLAANSGATLSAIRNATDAAIQNQVDAVVDALVVAYGG